MASGPVPTAPTFYLPDRWIECRVRMSCSKRIRADDSSEMKLNFSTSNGLQVHSAMTNSPPSGTAESLLPLWNSERGFWAFAVRFFKGSVRKAGTRNGNLLQWVFRNQFRNEFRKVSMHFDNSKTDKDRRNGDGVRRKGTRWGGSDPTLCGNPTAQTPPGVRGSLPPARFQILNSVAGIPRCRI